MITKPTLFILGAGASIPYGFPSGWDLRHQICSATTGQFNVRFKNLTECQGISTNVLIEFAQRFKKSGVASIDSFLSRHNDLADLGKSIIAAALVPLEDDSVFNTYGNADDWYGLLWNSLVSTYNPIVTDEVLTIFMRINTSGDITYPTISKLIRIDINSGNAHGGSEAIPHK